jgi:nuclear GTP-binding protein
MKRIYLIDCPGVVVDTAGDTEIDSVLKGVVRAERLESPEDFIDAILEQVQRKHVAAQYGFVTKKDDECGTWTSSVDLLEKIALKAGRLRKGGEPDIRSSAITIINDFQRGKLPHYVPPPELKNDTTLRSYSNTNNTSLLKTNITVIPQDLDAVGEEYMTNTMSEDEVGNNNLPPVSTTNDSEDDDDLSSSNIDTKYDDEDDDDDTLPPVIVAGAQWDD